MRRSIIIGVVVVVAIGVLVFGLLGRVEQEVFVLPEGYKGCVLIVYDVDGKPEIESSGLGRKTYEIPPSGILETGSEKSYGTKRMPKFFFKDPSGQLHELSYALPAELDAFRDRGEVAVFTMEYGEDYKPWKSFIVGPVGEQKLCPDRQMFVREYLNKFQP